MRKNMNQVGEIDLVELAIECGRHWVRILISTLVVAVIAFVASVTLITPEYSSVSKLYVLSNSTSITSLADIQIGSDLTSDYAAVINSRPVLDQVIGNLELEDENYSSLGSRISVNNPSDTRILEIKVSDSDPQMAKTIADETADVAAAFIADKMNQDPPSVLQYGYVATSSDSPNIKKNTGIGAIVGFLLAVITVTVGFLLNDTIMTADDLEKKLELNTLTCVPMVKEGRDSAHKSHHHKKGKNETKSNTQQSDVRQTESTSEQKQA